MSDSEFFINEITSTEDLQRMETAKLVGDALVKHYPGYPWLVCWQGGAIVVKNLVMGSHYGMILDRAEEYSSSAIEKDAIMKGGEFLERAGLTRSGKWDGTMPTYLEGSDPKIWKPIH